MALIEVLVAARVVVVVEVEVEASEVVVGSTVVVVVGAAVVDVVALASRSVLGHPSSGAGIKLNTPRYSAASPRGTIRSR